MSTTDTPRQRESPSPRVTFLDAYEREHATTMRVLRAYPTDKLELRPHAKCKTARELAWVFVVERMLGVMVWNDAFANGPPEGDTPEPPADWDELLAMLERAHAEFAQLIARASDDDLFRKVKFFTAPQTLGEVRRLDMIWFLLHDQIHHRGQFSVYLRMADAHVPSIYGPTADEPWM